ncbi:hypothetical protein ACOBQB_37290 [Streptomyces sp. G5(2025)]|uniref:hypothetical protein n=1 Tax=Streptomyces sp. G5(2025) TaxID=3406628 RepID=UPI003C1BCCAA
MAAKADAIRGARTAWSRRGTRALAAVGTVAVLLATGVTAGHASTPLRPSVVEAARPSATLKCALTTGPRGRIQFSRAVSTTPRQISARGTLKLNNCTSPDGRQPRIRSGRLEVSGSGRASCSKVTDVKGTGTFTWYSGAHRTGRVVGRSKVVPVSNGRRGYTPVDSFLSGKIVSGRMAGRSVTGSAVPTNDVRKCFAGGLDHVKGRGRMTVG